MGGFLCPRRGRDTRPVRNRMTRRVSLDTPQIRNEDNGLHTWQGGGVREQSDLTHRRHRVSDKIAMHGCSLDVRGNYDGVLP
jgi:hypothetical protein